MYKTFVFDYLPWLISIITLWMMYLAGNKNRGAWTVGIICQALWSWWLIETKAWGLAPLTLGMWAIVITNYVKWRE